MIDIHLMLVEDNVPDAELLAAQIRNMPVARFRVEVAHSEAGALELLARRGPFDIVLSDYNLGDGNGANVLREAAASCASAVLFMYGTQGFPPMQLVPRANIITKDYALGALQEFVKKAFQRCAGSLSTECALRSRPVAASDFDVEEVERLVDRAVYGRGLTKEARLVLYRRVVALSEPALEAKALSPRCRLFVVEWRILTGGVGRANLGEALAAAEVVDVRESLDRLRALAERGDIEGDRAEILAAYRERLCTNPQGDPGELPVMFHLSDLHFGVASDGRRMHRFDPALSLARTLIAEMDSLASPWRIGPIPTIVVISGDVGYRSDNQEYIAAKAFVDEFLGAT